MAFLASFIQYAVIMIILAAIGLLGGFVGVKLSQKKTAKKAETASEE